MDFQNTYFQQNSKELCSHMMNICRNSADEMNSENGKQHGRLQNLLPNLRKVPEAPETENIFISQFFQIFHFSTCHTLRRDSCKPLHLSVSPSLHFDFRIKSVFSGPAADPRGRNGVSSGKSRRCSLRRRKRAYEALCLLSTTTKK